MKVFVLCCNDYPDTVFLDEQSAQSAAQEKRENEPTILSSVAVFCHWHVESAYLHGEFAEELDRLRQQVAELEKEFKSYGSTAAVLRTMAEANLEAEKHAEHPDDAEMFGRIAGQLKTRAKMLEAKTDRS